VNRGAIRSLRGTARIPRAGVRVGAAIRATRAQALATRLEQALADAGLIYGRTVLKISQTLLEFLATA
jgi:hypothetical protein